MPDQQPGQDIPYYAAPPLQGQPSYGMAPVVEQEEGWGKIGIAMVSLALIFAGGVAYFIATSGDEELATASAETPALVEANAPLVNSDAGPKTSAAEPAIPSAADETRQALLDSAGSDAGVEAIAAVGVDASTEQSGPLRANGEVDRPAGLVSLSLETEPSGADVIRKRDGVRLGKTPYLYETEAVPGSVQFVLQLEGYKSMSLSLPSDRDGVRQIMLLPGKGGATVPAPSEAVEAPSVKKEPATAKPKVVKTAPKKAAPKKAAPKKVRKPKGGRVDYNADPIPLD